MKRMKAALLFLSLGAGAGMGCATTYDPYYYDTVYYDPYYGAYDAAWAYTWVDPVYGYWYYAIGNVQAMATVDPNTAASQLAANASTAFTPAGCVTATATGATVNYAFNNCTAPVSLTQISGNVELVLSDNQGQLAATATSNQLTINGEPYNLSLQIAGQPPDGDTRKVTVTSNSFSPNRFDSRTSQSTVTWTGGSGCITVDSTTQATKGGLNSTSTVSGYQRCDHQCPTAGMVQVDTTEGTFTTTFDGTNTARVTAPNDEIKTFNIDC
ncbi:MULTISPECIES: hypothetical protein [unclassified Corallococcus]|uniref:hypothetical protein n=1 Tax=Corallococcus TaxID=83461 RepID=UPI001CBE09B5|nr:MULTISPECIES: hypothetical protein [unclassified Corallococcus]MBZ4333401.1 hypothetical protein [Corallococcus sp. AS-1-12]MBZ4371915.1 hypothetical protein [Corallococcus sp. AS-1-6]